MSRNCRVPNDEQWSSAWRRCNYYESDDWRTAGGACMFSSIPRGHCCYTAFGSAPALTRDQAATVVRNASRVLYQIEWRAKQSRSQTVVIKEDIRLIRND